MAGAGARLDRSVGFGQHTPPLPNTLPTMGLRLDRSFSMRRCLASAAIAASSTACTDPLASIPGESATSSSGGEPTATVDPTTFGEATTDATTDATTAGTTIDPDSSGSSDSSATDPSTTTTESSESSATTEVESSSSDGGNSDQCPTDTIGPSVPDTVPGNTFGTTDDFSGSCGGAGGPDREFVFTAPAAGTYTFDTRGSALDTVLYVLDGECMGAELGCNDDGDGPQSALAVDLEDGQTVTVVVDGDAAGGLPFNLRVQSGSLVCPLADLGNTVPQSAAGDTTNLFAGTAGSCGGVAGREAAYLFTAPVTGTYSFDTFGSAFESVLYVRDGACAGAELACGNEGLLVDLQIGQQVTVVIDSSGVGGAYELHIGGLGGACPDSDLGNGFPQTIVGDTSDGDNTESASCGGAFSPDDLYLFTAPQAGLYQFDTIGSELDTVVYVQDGGCGGPELDCNDDWMANDAASRVIEGLAAGQSVIVGVDGNGAGAYEFHVDLVPCPDESLGNTVPQSVNDTTQAGVDKLHPSCGQSGPLDESPDHAYSFTAPADGVYTFDTFGTFFDTTLYVLDGAACNGPEIACNDDYQGDQASALSVQLVADQTVIVVADGDFLSEGPFTLNVGELDGSCPDEDLGNALPAVAPGSTAGADNAGFGSCGGLSGNDWSFTWTAPADAFYVFDTSGSSYDTVVHVRDAACNGLELDCDATDFSGQARAGAQLASGQLVVVTVDGDGVEGDFTLTIDEAPAGGNCCEVHPETGCDNPAVEDCVCEIDGYCCNNNWDGICVDEAIEICGAICV